MGREHLLDKFKICHNTSRIICKFNVKSKWSSKPMFEVCLTL